ncbi:MAG: hypothetical protein U5K84_07325 [Alkalibacterium sp.]|nr:hypothetical protein [Alkalibacterium sp.]
MKKARADDLLIEQGWAEDHQSEAVHYVRQGLRGEEEKIFTSR